ncbi:MAG: hypothetical protein HZA92_12765, partial [Verrucomicrobia bacterium]|nr:hypothetical protein [Verrucomicrobiota bacterium]
MKLLSILLTFPLTVALCMAAEKKAADSKAPATKAPPANLQPNPRKLNPPPGVVVPADVKAELTAGAAALGKEIEALRESLKAKPALLALLPDVLIYHNAVRYALEDDIFTSTNQFNSARALLKVGSERAKQLDAGNAPWNTRAGLLEVKRAMETAAAEAASKKKPPVPAPAPLTH